MDSKIAQEGQYIAGMLDQGDVRDAAVRINQDLYQLDPYSGRQLLAATRAYEQGGGSDLVLHQAQDQWGQIDPDRLAVGIATPAQDDNGRTCWDVQDVTTISTGARQTYQEDLSGSEQYRDYNNPGWTSRSPNGWVTPRQQIWGQSSDYFGRGGVPYSHNQTYGLPGSKYAYAIASSPWNYSTVGQQDWQDQDRPSRWDRSWQNQDRSSQWDPSYRTDVDYDGDGDRSYVVDNGFRGDNFDYAPVYNPGYNVGYRPDLMSTLVTVGALGALSLSLGRRRY